MVSALAFVYGLPLGAIAVAYGIVRGLKWLGELDNDVEL